MNDFINYVLGFYGKDGVYDMGATRDQVHHAALLRLDPEGEYKSIPFGFDTTDREIIREILIDTYSLVFPTAWWCKAGSIPASSFRDLTLLIQT